MSCPMGSHAVSPRRRAESGQQGASQQHRTYLLDIQNRSEWILGAFFAVSREFNGSYNYHK